MDDLSLNITTGKFPKVYFASNLHNNGYLVPHFIDNILSLVFTLGKENIFISIYESGSSDGTQ